MGSLDGRVAVITGSGSGIGRATALRFMADGANVVVVDLNADAADETVQLAAAQGHADRAVAVVCDVTDEAQIVAAIERAVTQFGGLDCMFNNAGVPGALGPLTSVDADAWDFTMAVLLRGPFLGTKHAARWMIENGRGGTILNTASLAGLSGASGPRAYSVAKAAVVHLTTVTSVDLAPHRIRVNAICPGAIATPIGGEDAAARLANAQPWPDSGTVDDIASAASFLTSDDARFITGHALVVDGGALARGVAMEERLGRTEWTSLVGVHHGTTGRRSEIHRLGGQAPSSSAP